MLYSKTVAAFIFGMTGMTLDPVELHIMLFKKRQKLFPEVYVQGRLFVGFYPALFLPPVNPALCYAVNDVFAVCCKDHTARFFKSRKPRNYAKKLHTVVGCLRIAA